MEWANNVDTISEIYKDMASGKLQIRRQLHFLTTPLRFDNSNLRNPFEYK